MNGDVDIMNDKTPEILQKDFFLSCRFEVGGLVVLQLLSWLIIAVEFSLQVKTSHAGFNANKVEGH